MENIFIILLGITMIYMSATSRLLAHINMLSFQGWLLFFIAIGSFNNMNLLNLLFIIFETIIVKAIIIPIFLKKVLKNTGIKRDSEANIPHFYALVISSFILFFGFLLANVQMPALKMISPIYFGVSIAIIIISLWLITVKHTVLSNVISFITMENGIFLLSLSVAKEMPVIVNLGVLLDIFIAVFILGMLIREIDSEFDDLEVSALSDLKDYE